MRHARSSAIGYFNHHVEESRSFAPSHRGCAAAWWHFSSQFRYQRNIPEAVIRGMVALHGCSRMSIVPIRTNAAPSHPLSYHASALDSCINPIVLCRRTISQASSLVSLVVNGAGSSLYRLPYPGTCIMHYYRVVTGASTLSSRLWPSTSGPPHQPPPFQSPPTLGALLLSLNNHSLHA